MIRKKLGVGIIGANPKRGWAMRGHIPALKLLPDDFKIVEVCTTPIESAQKAANTLTFLLLIQILINSVPILMSI